MCLQSKMVLIKEVAAAKRDSDISSYKQTIQEQILDLQIIASGEEDLYRLKTISSSLKHLCSGKKRLSEDNKSRDREYQRKRYAEKKEEIIQRKKDRRKEMRSLRENVQNGEDITIVVSGS